LFFRGSRYENVPTAEATVEGRTVRYKRTRFITDPPADRTHTVTDADRPDLIAHAYLQNAELFWRVCDANDVAWPPELVATPGEQIAIPAAGE
jgi:hypothetical protein